MSESNIHNIQEVPELNEHQKKIVGLAKICHEAQRAFCQTMGDFSHPNWDLTSPWYQKVMVECVTFVFNKVSDVNQLHIFWSSQMTALGWSYGLVFNEKEKEHPNLKNFNDISFEEQIKYAIFMANVIAISPAMVRASETTEG